LISGAASFLLLGQIHSPSHPERTTWFAVAVVLLILGMAAVIFGVLSALFQSREDAETPLEVVYDPGDPECRQIRLAEGDWQLRVRVRNRGRYGLNHVRARLSLESGYSHWLRIEHDNAPPYHRSTEGEILPASDEYAVYFDVGFWAPAEKA
jgi:hypothetical protein